MRMTGLLNLHSLLKLCPYPKFGPGQAWESQFRTIWRFHEKKNCFCFFRILLILTQCATLWIWSGIIRQQWVWYTIEVFCWIGDHGAASCYTLQNKGCSSMPRVSTFYVGLFNKLLAYYIQKILFFFLKNCNKLFECLMAYLISYIQNC